MSLDHLLFKGDLGDPDFVNLVRDLHNNPHVIDVREDLPKGDLQLEKTSPHVAMGMYVLLKEDDPDKAVQFFKKGLESNPQDPHAHHGLGLAYNQLGDRTEAYEHYTQALDFGGENWALRASTLANRGSTLFGLSRPADAIGDGIEALKLDPTLEIVYRNRGTFGLQLEDYEDALFWFDFGLQEIYGLPVPGSVNHNPLEHWKWLADVKKEASIPRNSSLMLGRVRALIGLKKYGEAREVLEFFDSDYESETVAKLKESIK